MAYTENLNFDLKDRLKGIHCSLEVNWNETVKDCKMVRLNCGNKAYVFERDDLFTALYGCLADNQRDKMRDAQLQKINKLTQKVTVGPLSKDYKKGESFDVTVEVPMSKIEIDFMKSELKKRVKSYVSLPQFIINPFKK